MSKLMRLGMLFSAIFCGVCTASLWANSDTAAPLAVRVVCTNGQNVSYLPVRVFDGNGQEIPGISSTDKNGEFVIVDTTFFTMPFFMWFTTPEGAVCGSYLIQLDSNTMGHVSLNYYPTELPCSCSKLVR